MDEACELNSGQLMPGQPGRTAGRPARGTGPARRGWPASGSGRLVPDPSSLTGGYATGSAVNGGRRPFPRRTRMRQGPSSPVAVLGRRRFQNRKVPSPNWFRLRPHPGGNVRRHLRTTLAVLLAVIGLAVIVPTSAASAQTSGPESFTGFLIATGVSGERVVLATNIRARGVFNGSGKIVELPPQPGDLDNMNRDDLVFRQGTLHLFSFVQDMQIVSFDPNSCRLAVTVTDTSRFAGGTGIFAGASGTGSGRVDGTGRAQRNPDGSCNLDLPPAHERDAVSGSSSL